ncbi:MAG: protein-L-isoaspartate O-methyltransferase, partial [Promethearchaeota archaeon]
EEHLINTGYGNTVTVICGDGTLGYPKKAPYDKILVTASSPKKVPPPLKQQLKDRGILCPAGSKEWGQDLFIISKIGKKFEFKKITGVRFVPLIGEWGFPE